MTAPRERSVGDLLRECAASAHEYPVRSLRYGFTREELTALAAYADAADALRARVSELLEYESAHGGDPGYESTLQDEYKGHDYDLTGLSRAYDAAMRDLMAKMEGGE
jgi:hypothetical protein